MSRQLPSPEELRAWLSGFVPRLRGEGVQVKGDCPLCGRKDDFSFHLGKGAGQCFAGCGTWSIKSLAEAVGVGLPPSWQKGTSTTHDVGEESARAEAEKFSVALWEGGIPAKEDSPYLVRKQVRAHDLRETTIPQGKSPLDFWAGRDVLVVPAADASGTVRGIQVIDPRGEKRFPRGLAKKGLFWPVDGGEALQGAPSLILCEGPATAATLKEILGMPTVACFDASNLVEVARVLRGKYPESEIIIAGDNDHKNATNAGLEAAEKAAALVGGRMVVPGFREGDEGTDWNDDYLQHGPESTREAFMQKMEAARREGDALAKGVPPARQRRKFTAKELYAADIPVPQWCVNQLVPRGLSVLASPPKIGKSYFSLQMAIAVARGEPFLGQQTTKCRVLLASLEDTPGRLRSRLAQLVPDLRDLPDDLDMVTEFPRLDGFGLQELEREIVESGYGLVVLDTWGKVKPVGSAKHGENSYETDVRVVGEVKAIADRHQCSVLLVHHLKKGGEREGDWLESLSGSMGLSATVDGLLAIQRKRGDDTAILKRSGRDLEDDEDLGMRWKSPGWEPCGNAKDVMISAARALIMESIQRAKEPVSPAYIAVDARQNSNTVRWHLMRMVQEGAILRTSDGKYWLSDKGKASLATNSPNTTNATNSTNTTNTTNSTNSTNSELSTDETQFSNCKGSRDSGVGGVGGGVLGTNSGKPSDCKALLASVGGVGAVGGKRHVDSNKGRAGEMAAENSSPSADHLPPSAQERYRDAYERMRRANISHEIAHQRAMDRAKEVA